MEYSDGKFIIPAESKLDAHDGMQARCEIRFLPGRPMPNEPTIYAYFAALGAVSEGKTCKVYAVTAEIDWKDDMTDKKSQQSPGRVMKVNMIP